MASYRNIYSFIRYHAAMAPALHLSKKAVRGVSAVGIRKVAERYPKIRKYFPNLPRTKQSQEIHERVLKKTRGKYSTNPSLFRKDRISGNVRRKEAATSARQAHAYHKRPNRTYGPRKNRGGTSKILGAKVTTNAGSPGPSVKKKTVNPKPSAAPKAPPVSRPRKTAAPQTASRAARKVSGKVISPEQVDARHRQPVASRVGSVRGAVTSTRTYPALSRKLTGMAVRTVSAKVLPPGATRDQRAKAIKALRKKSYGAVPRHYIRRIKRQYANEAASMIKPKQ